MKTVAIINLKGGVAKTTTAVSLAELLAEGDKRRKRTGSRVLLFDNDKQGNASRIFGAYEREQEAGAGNAGRSGEPDGLLPLLRPGWNGSHIDRVEPRGCGRSRDVQVRV